MDYSSFVKNYFRHAITELEKHRTYNGRIVQLSKELDIPSEFLHEEEPKNMFLPAFSLNIDAPSNYFVTFMSYYVNLMPDLNIVFANEDKIKEVYKRAVDMNILEDNELTMKYIELMIGVGVKVLEEQGILD